MDSLRKKAAYAIIGLLSLATGVGLSVNRALDFHGKTTARDRIRLVVDSPEVRQLIVNQEAEIASEDLQDESRQPEKYMPRRLAFIASMDRQPFIMVVAQNSYCRFLKQTRASCSKNPFSDGSYMKVRITTGPSKGQEGWSCMSEDVALSGTSLP